MLIFFLFFQWQQNNGFELVGDMMLFNPLYQHCLSSRTSFYKNKDIFSLSLYLKTAIVGKNDNTLPLTNSEMYSLEQR
jgi:hypothetical protein